MFRGAIDCSVCYLLPCPTSHGSRPPPVGLGVCDATLDFGALSIKETNDSADFSVRLLVTKDSGFIDEELKREFGSVVDIGCSETDGLPEDEGLWPDENGFHEYVAIVGLPLRIP